jgi:hypothetical protein
MLSTSVRAGTKELLGVVSVVLPSDLVLLAAENAARGLAALANPAPIAYIP